MITKTIHVNKPFTFRSILKGINQTVEDDYNCVVPTVKDIIISVEKDEINFINNIKNIFN